MSSLNVTSRAACGEPNTILPDISTWTGVHLHSHSCKIHISDRPQGNSTNSQLAQLYEMVSDTFLDLKAYYLPLANAIISHPIRR